MWWMTWRRFGGKYLGQREKCGSMVYGDPFRSFRPHGATPVVLRLEQFSHAPVPSVVARLFAALPWRAQMKETWSAQPLMLLNKAIREWRKRLMRMSGYLRNLLSKSNIEESKMEDVEEEGRRRGRQRGKVEG